MPSYFLSNVLENGTSNIELTFIIGEAVSEERAKGGANKRAATPARRLGKSFPVRSSSFSFGPSSSPLYRALGPGHLTHKSGSFPVSQFEAL